MEKPYITVVIVCYDRKKFILKAISSALNQTLDKTKYEIIVVKAFKDETIDKFIKIHNIKNIYSPNKREGFRLSIALKRAKGEVIALLDDDDEFAPKKLEIIYKYFIENPNLDFYHNNFYSINESGKIIAKPNDTNSKRVIKASNEREKLNLLNNIETFHPEQNASAMAVRKRLLLNNITNLKKITVALDGFLFLIGLAEGKELWIDSKPLSFYRLHSIGQVTNGPLTTFYSFYKHRKKFTLIAVKDTYILYNIAKGTIFEDFVKQKLSLSKLYYKLYNNSSKKVKYLPTLSDYFCFLSKPSKNKISFALQTLAPGFLRTAVLKMIYKHYVKERKII